MTYRQWYSGLNIHQKIYAKEVFVLVCGVEFAELSCLFSINERMSIFYDKMTAEV